MIAIVVIIYCYRHSRHYHHYCHYHRSHYPHCFHFVISVNIFVEIITIKDIIAIIIAIALFTIEIIIVVIINTNAVVLSSLRNPGLLYEGQQPNMLLFLVDVIDIKLLCLYQLLFTLIFSYIIFLINNAQLSIYICEHI